MTNAEDLGGTLTEEHRVDLNGGPSCIVATAAQQQIRADEAFLNLAGVLRPMNRKRLRVRPCSSAGTGLAAQSNRYADV